MPPHKSTMPRPTIPRPTILQILPRLDTGGAERAAPEIAQALAAAGARALVAAEPGRLVADVRAAGGEFIEFPAATKNPVRILANARALMRLITAEGIDLVHARSRAPAWSALIAARRTGRPFVTTYHGAYNEPNAIKRLYNSVMARSDVVIANSRYTADLIKSRYGTPEARIAIVYRGLDPDIFAPEAVSAERIAALRAAWGVAPDQPVILHPARLTAWKGQPVVIEAASLLVREGGIGNAVVVLAGDAQGREGYADALRAQIAGLGLGDRVRIVGHVQDIAAAYRAAHVTVLASTQPEAFGRTATEAEAMECPVIATAIGAPPETVLCAAPGLPGPTGWLIPPADARALADALRQALGLSAEARAAVGARVRAHVLGRFTVDEMRRQTLAVYDRLLHTNLAGKTG